MPPRVPTHASLQSWVLNGKHKEQRRRAQLSESIRGPGSVKLFVDAADWKHREEGNDSAAVARAIAAARKAGYP